MTADMQDDAASIDYGRALADAAAFLARTPATERVVEHFEMRGDTLAAYLDVIYPTPALAPAHVAAR